MKKSLYFIVLVIAFFAVAGFSAVQAADKTVVKVQLIGDFQQEDATDPVSGKTKQGVHVLEEAFEQLHPEFDLQYIIMGWDDYQKKTQSMMLSGEADVYQAPGIASLADQGLLEPLQPYIDADNFNLDVYIKGQVDGWKAVAPEDTELQIYGLPFIGDTRFIIFDKQLFDEWGVEYLSATPTVEEILEKAAKLTGTNPVSGVENFGIFHKGTDAGDTVMNLNEYYGGIWGTGNRFSELTVNFDTAEMAKALETLLALNAFAPDGVMANQGGELFGTEENNCAINVRANPAALFRIQALGLDERYGISRLFINEEQGMGGMFAGSPNVIGASSQVKDAAWEYLKFTASDAFAEYWWANQTNEGLPVIKAALEFETIKNNENTSAIIKSMEYLWTPRYIYRSGQPRYILTTAVEEVALNGKPIADALSAAQKEADEWISIQ